MTEGGLGVTFPEKGLVARGKGNKHLGSLNGEKFTGQQRSYNFLNRK
jgi:hypothetical protein